MSPNSSAVGVVCECHHLSVFSANMLIEPNKLDPFKLSLFLGVFYNPVVLILVICTWCIYALLLVWAWRKDNSDIMKVTIVLFNYTKTCLLINTHQRLYLLNLNYLLLAVPNQQINKHNPKDDLWTSYILRNQTLIASVKLCGSMHNFKIKRTY